MDIKRAIQKNFWFVVFVAILGAIFYLVQLKYSFIYYVRKMAKNDVVQYAFVTVAAVSIVIHFFKQYIISTYVKSMKHAVMETMRVHHERLEEKVRKLNAELSAAKIKLNAEIENRPKDQRELHQRLLHLNCLYGLSKIINRQVIPLDQIFQQTICLIREAYRYPHTMSVRIIFDGIRYEGDGFNKSEHSRNEPIKVNDKDAGMIEVYYLGNQVKNSEEMFTKEEDDLLRAIAEWLSSIAERKRAEERLRLFRNLIERSNDYIFAVEPKWGRILDVNTRACESLGYTRNELLNMMTIMDIEASSPDDAPWDEQIDVLMDKRDIVKESQYRRKDGTVFFVETSLKLVTQEKQDYIIAIARDITERKRAESRLKATQDKLLETARKIGMAEVATGVLHNVGNVLNSVSVTTESIHNRICKSKISYLTDVTNLIEDHADDLGRFITTEEQGKKLPVFLTHLSKELVDEQARCLEDMEALMKHIQHMANIIQIQQSHSKVKGLVSPTSIGELVDDAIQINAELIKQNHINVKRELIDIHNLMLDRHKVIQILTNLISNAVHALSDNTHDERVLTITSVLSKQDYLSIRVSDNGIGIPQENLTRIFEHGFTTKQNGHGFGLHNTALSVNQLNGSITVHSDGPGKGATFTVELPFQTQGAAK